MAEMNQHSENGRVSSWFLGPKAENFEGFKALILDIVTKHVEGRRSLDNTDASFITREMIEHPSARQSITTLGDKLTEVMGNLANSSIPFWSTLYNAHMNMDTTMASTLGYIAAMMYNPNNVTPESSPYTTHIEHKVGNQLCKMVGYNVDCGDPEKAIGWGHITCDGSVANLEATWAVQDANRLRRPFKDLEGWDLLNLPPSEVLDLPTRLAREYGISPAFLEYALKNCLVQTIGMEALERAFNIQEPARFFINSTRHYSWPKGGAITGLGSDRFVNGVVDRYARMDMADLEAKLKYYYMKKIPVFGVIAMIGSTSHGACDPRERIIELREVYMKKGLSFIVHCDAAWGGYFASTLEPPESPTPVTTSLVLKPYTVAQLRSGYIHYLAGGLCYRDERTRYLITWTSPIIHHNGDENDSMGIYGVEGSKPGAAPVAVWLYHETIGLNSAGYGLLLGKALFASVKLYCHVATMTIGDDGEGDDDLVVVPFNMLPAEQNGTVPWTSKPVFKEIGSDLMINSFAFNFRMNGVPNKDVNEANYLNTRIFQRLSIRARDDTETDERPLILTETEMSPNTYGDSLETYKERLGLGKEAVGDLKSLVSVTMSPWPSDPDFLKSMTNGLKNIPKQEIERCRKCNIPNPDHHGFIMQGGITFFLVHLPMFNMANHRRQLILEASIPDQVMKEYRRLRAAYPDSIFTLGNIERQHLNDLLQAEQFTARMDRGIPKMQPPANDPTGEPVMPDPLAPPFTVHITRKVVDRSLAFDNLENKYPELMPFYLYGFWERTPYGSYSDKVP
ncbi:group II decarboxylase [Aspergillus neoniger CBS 115656]|uniref:Group II decarboxylase n=1 Tax=Aspergillus neoniger (strain CBS 115656) TaxID=1448310 RepID=A0A318YTJ7_ASPNB|nr:group II decarboxylase [Aspergillus neoniger CBS 115656]PYH37756.1 group II decarboxylase [Aspergillus neoniger CBS 115656]